MVPFIVYHSYRAWNEIWYWLPFYSIASNWSHDMFYTKMCWMLLPPYLIYIASFIYSGLSMSLYTWKNHSQSGYWYEMLYHHLLRFSAQGERMQKSTRAAVADQNVWKYSLRWDIQTPYLRPAENRWYMTYSIRNWKTIVRTLIWTSSFLLNRHETNIFKLK